MGSDSAMLHKSTFAPPPSIRDTNNSRPVRLGYALECCQETNVFASEEVETMAWTNAEFLKGIAP